MSAIGTMLDTHIIPISLVGGRLGLEENWMPIFLITR
jgi:hypothetical protein